MENVREIIKTTSIEKRVKAAAIDLVLCWISANLLAIFPNMFLVQMIDSTSGLGMKLYLLLSGIIQIGFCGAYYIAPILINGKTVGKYITQTKIVSTNGKPLSRNQVLKRELIGKPIGIITFGALNILKDPEQKASWDLTAETKVIDEET